MDMLPTFEEAETRIDDGTDTPLDKFIVENEPAGEDAVEWREQLQDVLAWYGEE